MLQKSDQPSDQAGRDGIEDPAGKLSRRAAMTMMTAVTATPALAFVPAPTRSSSVDRREWDRAVATLKRVQAEYDRIYAKHTAAFDAAEADCPREEEFFSRYRLAWPGNPAKRAFNLRTAVAALCVERSPQNGVYFTDEECVEMGREAERVVDDFYAWGKRTDDARNLHRCHEWEERFNAVVERRWNAQDAVVEAKAPDHEAMLAKLELLVEMMDGEQDQERVMAIRDDARRLLGATTH